MVKSPSPKDSIPLTLILGSILVPFPLWAESFPPAAEPLLPATVPMTLAATPAQSPSQALFIAYPPLNHETTADKIFLIGTAPPTGQVTVNGTVIQRSAAGHFAPSFPLQVGENRFVVRYQDQERIVPVTRTAIEPPLPQGLAFGEKSLQPSVDLARLPGEPICFQAIAPPQATVSVTIGHQSVPLTRQEQVVDLPPNSSVLTRLNQPLFRSAISHYQGCATFPSPGKLGVPQFQLHLAGQTLQQPGTGQIEILSPLAIEVVKVTADSGTARTGPSSDYSRLTPLPKGTRAQITGREGDWYRLDYGAWIHKKDVSVATAAIPPKSLIRSVRSHTLPGWTELIFPLQSPVPVAVHQDADRFTLTLYNTTAQTDTVYITPDRIIDRMDWQQPQPGQVQYTFYLRSTQQWGYTLRYEGTSLILALRHPPTLASHSRGQSSPRSSDRPLQGMTILLDPGHGSENDLGARGPTGYPEKDATLVMAKLLREELLQLGAQVSLTREGDEDLYPNDRTAMIEKQQPTIALSLHYNALPDDGDAIHTQGVSAFWYHPQAYRLAVALHDALVQELGRPSDGVYWNNLALTRPTVAPSVLLEMGFMIHPEEFEWIINPTEQRRLAATLAQAIVRWLSE